MNQTVYIHARHSEHEGGWIVEYTDGFTDRIQVAGPFKRKYEVAQFARKLNSTYRLYTS